MAKDRGRNPFATHFAHFLNIFLKTWILFNGPSRVSCGELWEMHVLCLQKELIKFENHHVSPTELEAVMQEHPAVRYVYGVQKLCFGLISNEPLSGNHTLYTKSWV